ncbi:MAG TPA: ATP-binding protein [Candidatus Saccharimonadales bacterium]|nr:ATP-binding protein [Candidatus Saccharimonadales bacterium]
MSVSFIVTLLVSLGLSGLGVLVGVSPAASRYKHSFVALCGGLAIWVMANYLADVDVARSLFWTRLTFFSVTIAIISFSLFVDAFTSKILSHGWRKIFFWVSSIIILSITWIDAFVPNTTFEHGLESATVVTGPLYLLFVLYVVATLGMAITRLIRSRLRTRGLEREKVTFIIAAVVVLVVIASITNLILPLITGNNPLSRVGTYSTLLFTGIIAYAIIRHRLFSIRAVVARGLVYLLTLGSLTLIFATVVFFVADSINMFLGEESKVIYIIIAVLAALVFQPLKSFFNRLTERIFFVDLYDSKEILRDFSDIIAHHTLPEDLLKLSSTALKNVLHASFVVSYVWRDGKPEFVAGAGKHGHIDTSLFDKLPKGTVIVADEVSPKSNDSHALNVLQDYDGAVAVKLATSGERVGEMILGYKLNGGAYSNQDITLLATLANELAVAVQNALRFEEIARFNEKLKQEVNEATSQLRDSNRKLKKLDEAKDEFISMASHQLRTPLTSIKGYISMVLDGDAGKLNPSQAKLLGEAFTSSQRMVFLIADFLNVSRIQTGRFVLETHPTNLATIITDEIEQLTTTAARRNIKVTYTPPADFPVLDLDENKIRQVIMNFIDNAIYYSRPSGQVKVSLYNFGNVIRFEVADNGIGVPDDERHKLFTKFFRAENARRVRPDGTGIGLFMAKKVITAHGGTILFESKEGKGSTFGFSLHLPLKNHPEELVEKIAES